jgi:hypothetical protein
MNPKNMIIIFDGKQVSLKTNSKRVVGGGNTIIMLKLNGFLRLGMNFSSP